jgi:SAM-dependent methyltransferase
MENSLYAQPPAPHSLSQQDCHFYHVMEIPGHGVTTGDWDLRKGFDDYFGHVSFKNKRVLEIGPASGQLTFEMEKRGADVVAVEVTDAPGWDFVPYPPSVLEPEYGPRREIMRKLKNSFWFAHEAHKSKAKLYYGDVYNLPKELGHFDISVMLAVLLHTRNPLKIVEQCAQMSDTVVITDMFYPHLEDKAVCELLPTPQSKRWDTWWRFSTKFFTQFLEVMGFKHFTITTHSQLHMGKVYLFFTIIATR